MEGKGGSRTENSMLCVNIEGNLDFGQPVKGFILRMAKGLELLIIFQGRRIDVRGLVTWSVLINFSIPLTV